MKSIPIIIIPLILLGCSNNHKYTYTEYTDNQTFGEKVSEPEIITAKDDTTAFKEAYEKFHWHLMSFVSVLKSNPDLNMISVPVSFELQDQNGHKIFFEEIAERFDDLYDIFSSMPQNSKAYAGAEFGMSMDEVMKQDAFKGKKWSTYSDSIELREKVGKVTYLVSFHFYKNELYLVQFSSPMDFTSYFESVYDEIVNIRDVYTEAYGTPSFALGLPREGQLPNGASKLLYQWKSKKKTASISYIRSNRGKYRMWASVTDNERESRKRQEKEAIKKSKLEAEETLKAEAAKMF